MYEVTETVLFSYGHRLQGYVGKCANLHGHNGRVGVTLEAGALDSLGMCVDFYRISEALTSFVERELDHKLLLKKGDPLIPLLASVGEVYTELDENPTAEYLARLLFNHLASLGMPVKEVRFFETETSSACYRP